MITPTRLAFLFVFLAACSNDAPAPGDADSTADLTTPDDLTSSPDIARPIDCSQIDFHVSCVPPNTCATTPTPGMITWTCWCDNTGAWQCAGVLDPVQDLGSPDLTTSPDLAGLWGCNGYRTCMIGCGYPPDSACQVTCANQTRASAIMMYALMDNSCAGWCVNAAECAMGSRTSSAMYPDCARCVQDTTAYPEGHSCVDPNDFGCLAGACTDGTSGYMDCINDLP